LVFTGRCRWAVLLEGCGVQAGKGERFRVPGSVPERNVRYGKAGVIRWPLLGYRERRRKQMKPPVVPGISGKIPQLLPGLVPYKKILKRPDRSSASLPGTTGRLILYPGMAGP